MIQAERRSCLCKQFCSGVKARKAFRAQGDSRTPNSRGHTFLGQGRTGFRATTRISSGHKEAALLWVDRITNTCGSNLRQAQPVSRLLRLDYAPEREIDAAVDRRLGLWHLMEPEALSLAAHYEPMPLLQFKRDCFLCFPMSELKPPRSTERKLAIVGRSPRPASLSLCHPTLSPPCR